MALYADPVLETLITRLNASGPVKLRNKYYVGDPVVLPLGNFPMCFISRDTTEISVFDSSMDEHSMPIVLNLVYNGAADLNQKAFAQAGALGLYELCEARDESYNLRSDSIAGVLRSQEQVLDAAKNLYIDIEGSNTTIEYVLSPPTRRGVFSVEAIIRTTIKHVEVR